MAAEKTVNLLSIASTATSVLAANPDRLAAILRVVSGEVWFGPDNTVTADDGLYWTVNDGPLNDEIPTLDAWYAIARAGTTAKICTLEVTDVP